jgi:hypothetical protein
VKNLKPTLICGRRFVVYFPKVLVRECKPARCQNTPVEWLTLAELSALLQKLADRVLLDKPRSGRMIDSPKKRWPDYLTTVRRLRNEAAHLRNISFQDIEDLLDILNAVRRDQLDFLIVP